MKRPFAAAHPLLLSALLLGCGRTEEDPTPPPVPVLTTVRTTVPDALQAPATATPMSAMQVRVTILGMGQLPSSVVIGTNASPAGAAFQLTPYTKTFNGSDYVEVFNVGTMAPYPAAGLVYHYDAQVRIPNFTSYAALPSTANIWVEIVKAGTVVATNRIASSDRNLIRGAWRDGQTFLYSGCTYSSD